MKHIVLFINFVLPLVKEVRIRKLRGRIYLTRGGF
jgi:hypothetical protein